MIRLNLEEIALEYCDNLEFEANERSVILEFVEHLRNILETELGA